MNSKTKDGFSAAYRELEEETGITQGQVTLRSEKHPLKFLPLAGENFFDLEKYAGEGNIGHMIEQVNDYGEGDMKCTK